MVNSPKQSTQQIYGMILNTSLNRVGEYDAVSVNFLEILTMDLFSLAQRYVFSKLRVTQECCLLFKLFLSLNMIERS